MPAPNFRGGRQGGRGGACSKFSAGGCLLQIFWGKVPGQVPPQAGTPPGRHPPQAGTPLQAGTPPPGRHPPGRHPPGRHPPRQAPPPGRHPPGIRSTLGRYASYWNAFLLDLSFCALELYNLIIVCPRIAYVEINELQSELRKCSHNN